jgi:hypothetical protein
MANQQQHFDAARKFQAYYDDTLRQVGMRAPQPVLGQRVNDYRRETLRTIKRTFLPQNHELYKINYRGLPSDALGAFEPQLLKAAVDSASDPQLVPPGELRKIERLDEYGQIKTINWIGQDCFVRQMMLPGRRVVGFRTDQGYMNTNGQFKR